MHHSVRVLLPALWLLLVATAAPVAAAPPAETHPFSIHDMMKMRRISDPQVSPDGKQVAFTVWTADLEANRGRLDVWLAPLVGEAAPRRLTTAEAADYGARWAPDGQSLYFLSTRGGSAQVWRLPLAGGEAAPVTALALDVDNLVVAPDGKHLAVTAEVFPDCETLDCTMERLEAEKTRKSSGRLYTQLFVRHWDTWKDGRRRHLLVLPLAGPDRVGAPVLVMRGMDADAPSKPWGGTEELAFTPDGTGIVFAARDAGREEAWSTNLDLYLAPLDGSRPPASLTADNPAWDTAPTFSDDGQWLAWLAMERAGYEADRFRIRLMRWKGGPTKEVRTLTEAWDRSPGEIAWRPDGREIFAAADDLGQRTIFAIDVAGGAARRVVAEGTNQAVQPYGDRIVYLHDDLQGPVEIRTTDARGKAPRAVTDLNGAAVAATRRGAAEQFTFEGAHGDTVYGYLVKPVDFDPAQRYPVAFLVHGGPQGSFGNHFHYRWNPQVYAGAGFAAVMIDFHGSTGYGQAFTDAIRGDWGGAPYEDLMKGLDAALARYPFLDGDRTCALGASYGGYMVYWIAGQTDRFRCLVAHDGNIDERFAYFDTEELWFPEWEHGGTPWTNPEGYRKHNPVEYIQNWKTPLFVIHGELDYRVVVTQGIGAFNALQRLGVPSQFLHFPDENHWVLKPHNSILWHESVIAWLKKWTEP
jgi:dipeptidyl aminopeptidase/acylaminoacyl peptidase